MMNAIGGLSKQKGINCMRKVATFPPTNTGGNKGIGNFIVLILRFPYFGRTLLKFPNVQ